MKLNVEEEIIEWLSKQDFKHAARAARWIKAYGDITIAYCEFTGGHISREEMDRILSEQCFGVDLGKHS